MNVDVDGLRAAAEAATAGPWTALHGIGIGPGEVHAVDFTPLRRVSAASTKTDARYIAAADPVVVLALLDRLQAAEAAVERVRDELGDDSLRCGRFGLPCHVAIAESERWCRGCRLSRALEGPQEATGADLSASGAEGDHGDQREGEGLA